MPEHDLSRRGWGRNYEILQVIDEGQRLRMAIWATPMPDDGDFVILRHPEDRTTRYQLETVKPCGNPRDMAIATAKFAPRLSTPTTGG